MKIIGILLLLTAVGSSGYADLNFKNLEYSKNVINFAGNPASADSKSRSAFSDQGAWFGFGFLEPAVVQAGFSGPFLMTEQNGVWISPCFISLQLTDEKQHKAGIRRPA